MKGNDILEKLDFLLERGTITTDVAKNKAKYHVPLIGMRYKKKKRYNKLTGAYITVHEEKNIDEGAATYIDIEKDLPKEVYDVLMKNKIRKRYRPVRFRRKVHLTEKDIEEYDKMYIFKDGKLVKEKRINRPYIKYLDKDEIILFVKHRTRSEIYMHNDRYGEFV